MLLKSEPLRSRVFLLLLHPFRVFAASQIKTTRTGVTASGATICPCQAGSIVLGATLSARVLTFRATSDAQRLDATASSRSEAFVCATLNATLQIAARLT